MTNCTAALHLACVVLGIGAGDEVICPSLSFVATANCIRYTGATPVFADIRGVDDLCIDVEQIESLITDKTKAIIPMHYAGFPCDMDRIMEIAKRYHLYVIEDACHGPMSAYKGKKLGTIGDVGCFSFFSNKNISTGEGGMIVTNQEELYNKMKLMRSHGMTTMSFQRALGHATNYDVVDLGYNYRMDDIRASIGVIQLNKLKGDLDRREEVRNWYIEYLSRLVEEFICIPFRDHKEFISNYIFSIVLVNSTVEKRDLIRRILHNKGIQTSIHYPAIHRFSAYDMFSKSLPNTEYVSDNEITLPIYGMLEKRQVIFICDEIAKACNRF